MRRRTLLAVTLIALAVRPVAAANLVPGGSFDLPSDVDAWTAIDPDAAIAHTTAFDADACVASGAAIVTDSSSTAGQPVAVATCADVSGGTSYRLGLSALFEPQPVDGEVYALLLWWSSTACAGSPQGSQVTTPAAPSSIENSWVELEVDAASPPGAASASIALVVVKDQPTGTLEAVVDEVFLRPDGDLFADDFEAGETCRWSAALP